MINMFQQKAYSGLGAIQSFFKPAALKAREVFDWPKKYLSPMAYDLLLASLALIAILLGLYTAGLSLLTAGGVLLGSIAMASLALTTWTYWQHKKMPWVYYPAYYLEKDNVQFNTLAGNNSLSLTQAIYFLSRRWYRPPCQFAMGFDKYPVSTELHYAAEHGRGDLIELYLRHGADLGRKDLFDKTALTIAVENKHADIISMLAGDLSAKKNALHQKFGLAGTNLFKMAIENEDAASFQVLCELDSKCTHPMAKQDIPIKAAVQSGHLEILKLMIKHFKLSSSELIKEHQLLHKLVASQHQSTLSYFLKMGKSMINHKNEDGRTARDIANIMGLSTIEGLLAENGGELTLNRRQLNRIKSNRERQFQSIQDAMQGQGPAKSPKL